MTNMHSPETVFLESLGGTSQEIATQLESDGIKGTKRNASSCPISIALTRSLGGHYYIGNLTGCRRSADTSTTFKIPNAIMTFIHEFDSGAFPQLITVQE